MKHCSNKPLIKRKEVVESLSHKLFLWPYLIFVTQIIIIEESLILKILLKAREYFSSEKKVFNKHTGSGKRTQKMIQ